MMSSAHRCPEIKSRDYDANLRDGFFYFFPQDLAACGILIPQPRAGSRLPAAEAWSLNHWTVREVRKLQRSGSYRVLVSLGRNEPVL